MNTKTPEQIAALHCSSSVWGCWSDKGHDFRKCWTFDMIRLVVDTNEIKWLEEEKMAVEAERKRSTELFGALVGLLNQLGPSEDPVHPDQAKARMARARKALDDWERSGGA